MSGCSVIWASYARTELRDRDLLKRLKNDDDDEGR